MNKSPQSVATVGGGYIGIEMDEVFSARGFKVSVVEKPPRVLANYDEEISSKVREKLIEKGVSLIVDSGG